MFLINLQGKDSIYEQIKNQILRFIQNGVLSPNDKLPSVRQLAQELGINPNTVQKAYQELERDGYIYTLSKKGAFVSSQDRIGDDELKKQDFERLVTHYRDEGYQKQQLMTWIDAVYKEKKK